MKSDIEIAQETKLRPIKEIADRLGIQDDEFLPYGNFKAKISLRLLDRLKTRPDGRLIVVTAITPTALGEGKTTVAIGLSMALNRLGRSSIVALRQPSLGPVFGVKGGAAGGGYSQVVPMEDINLHFTGDFHAVTSAHNLLSAMIDNHFHFGNALNIEEREIFFPRTMDINDRSLRDIVVGLGGKKSGPAREDSFIITAASEIMAILGLAQSLPELKDHLAKILVALTRDGKPVTVEDFGVAGSMAVLLKDALKPNLVQTIEHTPALIHTGPFANIAHGTNSILATKMALKLSDYVVTETGFASDLGAEKFINIVARAAVFKPAASVLVATIRALKLHGGAPEKNLNAGTVSHLKAGLANLSKHIENLNLFGMKAVVALNAFTGDRDEEIAIVADFCKQRAVSCVRTDVFQQGGQGALELAQAIIETGTDPTPPHFTYPLDAPVTEKIEAVAKAVYGASRVIYSSPAEADLARIDALGYNRFPVCIAKTQRSLSDNSKLYGTPKDFKITIQNITIMAGAGYLVPIAGDIMRMPGLSKEPQALKIDLDETGRIIGLS